MTHSDRSDLARGEVGRRDFLQSAAAATAALALGPGALHAATLADDRAAVLAKVAPMHERTVQMLREWIALPSIAAENLNYPAGPEYMAQLARDAGFQRVKQIPTAGKPGVFAVMDNGAKTSLAVYFMYDVKQFDASEWSAPPLEGRLVERPGLGTVMIGRGATNQKGPQTTFLAALHAFRAAGKKPPVNIVLVCEGEEEIASPNFREIVFHPEVEAALRGCVGVMIPFGSQGANGAVQMNLGAKGPVEFELVASGEKWGRGPTKDIHSSYHAQVDSPAWHLVQALNSLVKADGHTPAVEGFLDDVRPLTPRQLQLLDAAVPRFNEADVKKALGVSRWINDEPWRESLIRLVSQPTINIQGLVGGYTGPGGKTILPHRLAAKLEVRMVPNMTFQRTKELIRAHLDRHGFGDIEMHVTGGYDPTETDPDARLVKAQQAAYKVMGIDPVLWPRLAGSWPGVTFTGEPLRLPAMGYGLGHGGGAHAPDEFWLVRSTNPRVEGIDGAVKSYIELLYQLA